jgi:hypothetical protein
MGRPKHHISSRARDELRRCLDELKAKKRPKEKLVDYKGNVAELAPGDRGWFAAKLGVPPSAITEILKEDGARARDNSAALLPALLYFQLSPALIFSDDEEISGAEVMQRVEEALELVRGQLERGSAEPWEVVIRPGRTPEKPGK